MSAKTILVIRHAEKPEHRIADGVDANGKPDAKSLTPRGWQRAGALVQFFAPGDGAPRLPLKRPKYLFAARADQSRDSHSKRPYQTIEPLAAHLKPAGGIDQSYRKEDIKNLIDRASRLDDTVLIAWEHRNIPPLARLLIPASVTVPNWPEDRFDMVWVFDQVDDIWRLSQVPQLLLSGDKESLFA